MLNYYCPIHTIEGHTLSIDKMTIDYRMDNLDSVTALGQLLNVLPVRFAVDTKHWESLRIGLFRENYTVTFQNGDSFWLGAFLNCTRLNIIVCGWNLIRTNVLHMILFCLSSDFSTSTAAPRTPSLNAMTWLRI